MIDGKSVNPYALPAGLMERVTWSRSSCCRGNRVSDAAVFWDRFSPGGLKTNLSSSDVKGEELNEQPHRGSPETLVCRSGHL